MISTQVTFARQIVNFSAFNLVGTKIKQKKKNPPEGNHCKLANLSVPLVRSDFFVFFLYHFFKHNPFLRAYCLQQKKKNGETKSQRRQLINFMNIQIVSECTHSTRFHVRVCGSLSECDFLNWLWRFCGTKLFSLVFLAGWLERIAQANRMKGAFERRKKLVSALVERTALHSITNHYTNLSFFSEGNLTLNLCACFFLGSSFDLWYFFYFVAVQCEV